MTEELADRFLQTRRGPDGIDGTEDDAQFQSLDDVRVALGLNPDQFKQLASLIALNDPVYRVVSVGKAGGATRKIQLVFRRAGVVPQVITWREF
jgi:hypothetical protein